MFGTQLEKINLARTKALRVFVETKEKFEAAISKAQDYIEQNEEETRKLAEEQYELNQTNVALINQINAMKQSVREIDRVLGA